MKKPYSKRTQNLLQYAREQGEQIRDLDRSRRTARAERKSLHKKMVKKGPKGEDIILPGYHENVDAWNEEYDHELDMQDAQEETHYPMIELMQAAVREYGMPKSHKKRAKLRSKAAKRKQ
tara:strand:+ start:1197 stop:1556 length:360 start_codon:yes stop_codon:yes gene_type:complete